VAGGGSGGGGGRDWDNPDSGIVEPVISRIA